MLESLVFVERNEMERNKKPPRLLIKKRSYIEDYVGFYSERDFGDEVAV